MVQLRYCVVEKLHLLLQVFSEEAKNMQKMIASLKFLVDQQHADRAHVPPHGFPPGTKSDMIVCYYVTAWQHFR